MIPPWLHDLDFGGMHSTLKSRDAHNVTYVLCVNEKGWLFPAAASRHYSLIRMNGPWYSLMEIAATGFSGHRRWEGQIPTTFGIAIWGGLLRYMIRCGNSSLTKTSWLAIKLLPWLPAALFLGNVEQTGCETHNSENCRAFFCCAVYHNSW